MHTGSVMNRELGGSVMNRELGGSVMNRELGLEYKWDLFLAEEFLKICDVLFLVLHVQLCINIYVILFYSFIP